MKTCDFIYQYQSGYARTDPTLCRVRLFVNSNQIFCLLTDLGKRSIHSSVTNSIEEAWSSLLIDGYILENSILIEHYEPSTISSHTFDFVTISEAKRTKWEKVSVDKLVSILNTSRKELFDRTFKNQRHFERIENLQAKLAPNLKRSINEEIEVSLRKYEILDNAISKSQLNSLIESRSGEREMQKLLKLDLSVFGELYSSPYEEYIVFSEFPILDGKVDFVVFTGRSRMDVVLIEIKGANFKTITSNNYKNISAKANEAVQQIRKRCRSFIRNHSHYWKKFHEVRKKAESGQNIYNSFVGPRAGLQVDEFKDINIHMVVIAGWGKNDVDESDIRQDVYHNSSPHIQLESWNSFVNKLQRN